MMREIIAIGFMLLITHDLPTAAQIDKGRAHQLCFEVKMSSCTVSNDACFMQSHAAYADGGAKICAERLNQCRLAAENYCLERDVPIASVGPALSLPSRSRPSAKPDVILRLVQIINQCPTDAVIVVAWLKPGEEHYDSGKWLIKSRERRYLLQDGQNVKAMGGRPIYWLADTDGKSWHGADDIIDKADKKELFEISGMMETDLMTGGKGETAPIRTLVTNQKGNWAVLLNCP